MTHLNPLSYHRPYANPLGWIVYKPAVRIGEISCPEITPANICPWFLPSLPLVEFGRLPATAAVYFMITTGGSITYVGSTYDLFARFCEHAGRNPTARNLGHYHSGGSRYFQNTYRIDDTSRVYWFRWIPLNYELFSKETGRYKMELWLRQKHKSLADMRAFEADCIRRFRPLFNKRYNRDYRLPNAEIIELSRFRQ